VTTSNKPWRPLGRIMEAFGGRFSQSHAMLPTPILLPDRLRVFFASCDADLRGRVFFADLERREPYRVLSLHTEPVFDLGPRGAFDCDGVNPTQVFRRGERLLMFYVGWQRDVDDAPYALISGLAESRDDGFSFTRLRAPVLPPTAAERMFRTAAFARPEPGGWRLFYVAGSQFIPGPTRPLPVYSLKETTSASFEHWPDEGRELLAPDVEGGELGYGRPVVWDEGEEAVMLVSLRTRSGYELLRAPLEEVRRGRQPSEPVLTHPREAWESEMTCFGSPIRFEDRELLFYNGNQYGRSGFGLAWRPLG
jgi:hypothetical protein